MIHLVDVLKRLIKKERNPTFSVLSYTTENIGDEIQSVAALRLLPRVDRFIDREELNDACEVSKILLNGWFCHRPDKWPPSSKIQPLLISMHFTNNPEPGSGVRANDVFAKSPAVLEYLKEHGPVGARDSFTYDWLQSQGIDSYYSGCLTLTLDRPNVGRDEFVVINDVPETVAARIRALSKRTIRTTTHHDVIIKGIAARMRRAECLLELYARASCVVTTRLHGALPCLAMGTPVLLIDDSWDQSRFTALNDLVRHCSPEEFLTGNYRYDVDDPPPNPELHFALRDDLKRRVHAFVCSE